MTHLFVIPAKAGIHSTIRSRTSISDIYKFLDSRFRGNDNCLRFNQIYLKIALYELGTEATRHKVQFFYSVVMQVLSALVPL